MKRHPEFTASRDLREDAPGRGQHGFGSGLHIIDTSLIIVSWASFEVEHYGDTHQYSRAANIRSLSAEAGCVLLERIPGSAIAGNRPIDCRLP